MRGVRRQSCWLIPALGLLLLPSNPAGSGTDESSSRPGPAAEPVRQPVPFSHLSHSRLGLDCPACHPMSGNGDSAGFPPLALCLSCHRDGEQQPSDASALLEDYERQGQEVPWVRIYRIPDFVFFSHTSHLAAGGTCSECHGPVEERDILGKEVSTSMQSCIDCHKSREASVECHLCHELNQ